MTTHTQALTGTVSGLASATQANVISENLAKMVSSGTAPTTTSTGFLTLSGMWWHDTANNQVKVRDLADTTWIVVGSFDQTAKTFVAAATGIAAIQGAVKNLKIDTRSGSVIITADELVVETTGNTFGVVRTVSATIVPTTTGANGRDTGSLAANTWYSVWIIYNGATVAGLISASATAPTMPSGYTYKARVGWVRTNATPVLLPTLQIGDVAQYIVDGSLLTGLPQIAGGGVGNPSTPTWSAAAWATFAPASARRLSFVLSGTNSTNGNAAIAPNGNYGGGSSGTNSPVGLLWGMTNGGGAVQVQLVPESANIYVATQNNARIYVAGWEDNR